MEIVPPERLAQALFWARITAANGTMEDALRLVHVLALKLEYMERNLIAGSLDEVRTEAMALLAIIVDGPDRGMSAAACNVLTDMLAGSAANDPRIQRASYLLMVGDHHAPTFAALVASLPASQPAASSSGVADDAQRRATCFESLAAALANAHGLDRETAHLLITSTPDYSPELLDTKDGWDSIFAAASLAMGDEPAVATTAH